MRLVAGTARSMGVAVPDHQKKPSRPWMIGGDAAVR